MFFFYRKKHTQQKSKFAIRQSPRGGMLVRNITREGDKNRSALRNKKPKRPSAITVMIQPALGEN